jgi:uncharacterized protein YggL (DUF469 family)
MKNSKAYIYVRTHESYDKYDSYKLGRTQNVPERDDTYSTNEIKRGQMISVFEVSLCQVNNIERKLQEEFCNMNVRINAGKEFYKKEMVALIEPYFQKNGIEYRRLEKKEIDGLLRMYRIQKIRQEFEEIHKQLIQNIERKYAEEQHAKEQEFIPIPYQEPIIHKIVSYLTINSKGITQLPCGTGKTIISLWSSKLLNFL